MRAKDLELHQIDADINYKLGWIPFLWISSLFLDTVFRCADALAQGDLRSIGSSLEEQESADFTFYYGITVFMMVYIAYLNNKFNINSLLENINRTIYLERSDQQVQIEMIRFVQEAEARFNNRPKVCSLFVVDFKLLLNFMSVAATMSVIILNFTRKPA